MRKYKLNVIANKKYKTFAFTDIWLQVFGEPETSGSWLIYGPEKNGKTWMALKLAEYLSRYAEVLYISGEEGLRKTFTDAVKRAKIDISNTKLKFTDYVGIDELHEDLLRRRSARVVFVDNITVYDELKYGGLKTLLTNHSDKLFVFLAHEENKQPYTSTAKLARKLAQIIIHIEGLSAKVSGRCPGGMLQIDETKAQLYWGATTIELPKNNSNDTH